VVLPEELSLDVLLPVELLPEELEEEPLFVCLTEVDSRPELPDEVDLSLVEGELTLLGVL
jgi:coenzyme F420-reducing hydrogenase gamma subunit